MKKRITSLTTFVFSLLILLISSCAATKDNTRFKVERLDVDDAFKKVYQATQQALAESHTETLKVEGIDLTFATTTTNTGGAGVKLWVISGSYSKSVGTARKATFSFKEDENTRKALVEDPKIKNYKEYLISVINAAKNIQKIGKFGLSEIQVDVEFTLTNSGEAGVEVEILPVTPSLTGKRERGYVHSITLKLKKQDK